MARSRRREAFELSLFGEGIERRYRRMRPEVEAMPWGTLDVSALSPRARLAARRSWTGAAFQEHRTGVACTLILRAMMEARVPLDLIAVATRFPLDEMVHVELCARMAMELGGGVELQHDPDAMVLEASRDVAPMYRAGDLIVRFLCVGEAISLAVLRGAWRATTQPLPRAVLGRIVKDEAAHAVFGYSFLDWAITRCDDDWKAHVGRSADLAIRDLEAQWASRKPQDDDATGETLGWMRTREFLDVARHTMETKVRAPLRERDIPISA